MFYENLSSCKLARKPKEKKRIVINPNPKHVYLQIKNIVQLRYKPSCSFICQASKNLKSPQLNNGYNPLNVRSKPMLTNLDSAWHMLGLVACRVGQGARRHAWFDDVSATSTLIPTRTGIEIRRTVLAARQTISYLPSASVPRVMAKHKLKENENKRNCPKENTMKHHHSS
jgi:hypothetical protein